MAVAAVIAANFYNGLKCVLLYFVNCVLNLEQHACLDGLRMDRRPPWPDTRGPLHGRLFGHQAWMGMFGRCSSDLLTNRAIQIWTFVYGNNVRPFVHCNSKCSDFLLAPALSLTYLLVRSGLRLYTRSTASLARPLLQRAVLSDRCRRIEICRQVRARPVRKIPCSVGHLS